MAWVKEIFYFPFVIILGILGLIYRPSVGQFSEKKINIVLVHGILTRTLSVFALRKKLERLGFNVIVPEYGYGLGDISKSAHKLNVFLDGKIKGETVLLGHSLGGVVILEAKRNNKNISKIPVVTLGSPIKGTPLAWLIFWLKAGRQLVPGSVFLQRLSRHAVNNGNTIVARARYDEITFANRNCVDGIPCKNLNVIGHAALLFDIADNELKELLQF